MLLLPSTWLRPASSVILPDPAALSPLTTICLAPGSIPDDASAHGALVVLSLCRSSREVLRQCLLVNGCVVFLFFRMCVQG
jgi:hypothetical protein